MRFLRILSCSSLSEQPCTMSHFSLSKPRKFWASFSGRYNWQAEWKTWITQSCLVTLGEIVDFSVNIGGGWQLFVSLLTVIFCETCIKWGVQVACSMCLELQRSLLYFSHFWCIQKCSFSSVFCPFPSLPVSNLMGRRSTGIYAFIQLSLSLHEPPPAPNGHPTQPEDLTYRTQEKETFQFILTSTQAHHVIQQVR